MCFAAVASLGGVVLEESSFSSVLHAASGRRARPTSRAAQLAVLAPCLHEPSNRVNDLAAKAQRGAL